MKKFLKSFRHGQKGFTLIELLIVIGILAILIAIAIPNIGKFMTSGTVGAANAELQMVITAVDSCMADAGVMTLSTSGTFTGDTGEVVATDAADLDYDAADYLTLKGDTLTGTYEVEADGTISDASYGTLTWTENATNTGGKFSAPTT